MTILKSKSKWSEATAEKYIMKVSNIGMWERGYWHCLSLSDRAAFPKLLAMMSAGRPIKL